MTIVENVLKKRRPKPKFPVLKSIAERFSPRVLHETTIPDNHVRCILEAARLAPSARFHQPWFFYVIRKDSAAYKKIKCCIPKRNEWALKASLFIIACYNPLDPNGEPNKWAQYDLGAAVISLVLQAQDLGYYSRQVGSYDTLEAKRQFAIEDPLIPFIIVAIGKMGDEKDYDRADKEYVEKDLTPPELKDVIYKELI